jgi:hypothetical protein
LIKHTTSTCFNNFAKTFTKLPYINCSLRHLNEHLVDPPQFKTLINTTILRECGELGTAGFVRRKGGEIGGGVIQKAKVGADM